VDWCSHEAAKYAVEHWHYSRSLPTPPVVRLGVWEGERFIGCVLFSRGASNNLGRPYSLDVTEVCELTRVALDHHDWPVTRIVALAIRMLRAQSPGIRLIVSFADPNEHHHGGIYQAGNWVYAGTTAASCKYRDPQGRLWHERQVSASGVNTQYGERRRVPRSADCVKIPQKGKHRYLYPLDKAMRAQIEPLRQPYPKRDSADEATQ